MNHPVISIFLSLKWRKSRKYFYIHSIIFFVFLFCYAIFIGYWFTRPESDCKRKHPRSIELQEQCTEEPPEYLQVALFQGNKSFMTATEAFLLISWLLLVVSGNTLIVLNWMELILSYLRTYSFLKNNFCFSWWVRQFKINTSRNLSSNIHKKAIF